MKIAIVDDERVFREKEKKLLEDHDKTYKIETYSSTKELLASGKVFDLLLLDIEMPDEDGIVFAKSHVREFPHILFVTSHDDRMQDAFNMNVVGFIIKNNQKEDFIKRVKEAMKRVERENKYTFKTSNGRIEIADRNIEYFYVTYECIYVMSGKSIRINVSSFNALCEGLPDHYFRISRNIVVNLHNVEEKYISTHEIEMKSGKKFKVSVRNWSEFKEAYVKVME